MNVPETIYRQIVMTRTITMEKGRAGFRLQYHFTNFGTALDLTPWFGCRINRASKSFYVPSSEGTRFCHDMDSNAAALSSATWPGPKGRAFPRRACASW